MGISGMHREPIIFVVGSALPQGQVALEDTLRGRYLEGYRIVAPAVDTDATSIMNWLLEEGEQIALFVYEQPAETGERPRFLDESGALFPDAHRLLLANSPDVDPAYFAPHTDVAHQSILYSWNPPEQKLYPVLDELLAEWRATV